MEGQQGYPLPQISILGYGNQGRAQALNYRDAGGKVVVGARLAGNAALKGKGDGFEVLTFSDAICASKILFFHLPDQVIPTVYQENLALLSGKWMGFAHGFAYHYKLLERVKGGHYFLVAPKGAGAILRKRFQQAQGLPIGYAIEQGAPQELRDFVIRYAKAIGAQGEPLETTFEQETECDLFGEQAVLCGGMLELIEAAQETLVRAGHDERMAFLETCYEAQRILDLLMSVGPAEMTRKISPTAFYGGATRGKRVITKENKKEMQKIFEEIRSGSFAREWMEEVQKGMPSLDKFREEIAKSSLQSAFEKVRPLIEEKP